MSAPILSTVKPSNQRMSRIKIRAQSIPDSLCLVPVPRSRPPRDATDGADKRTRCAHDVGRLARIKWRATYTSCTS
jgi:hypothetical protein